MKKAKKNILIVLLLLVFFTATVTARPIHLDSGSFDPASKDSKNAVTSYSTPEISKGDKLIVQFAQTPSKERKKELRELGVVFHTYIPENAWIISTSSRYTDIKSQRGVKYLKPLKGKDKVGKHLQRDLAHEKADLNVEVAFFRESKVDPESFLSRYGSIQRKVGEDNWNLRLVKDKVRELAENRSVKRVSRTSPGPETHNDGSRELIEADTLQSSENLNGTDFTAAIWDSGWAGEHNDLNYTDKIIFGDKNENCGNGCSVKEHGTHVAGTMLGGGSITYDYRGMAPDSRVATYEWPANNITELFEETNESIVSYNAIISQNSWGYQIDSNNKGLMGDYTGMADDYDVIISNETSQVRGKIPIVFSAGNEGNDWSFRYNTTTGPGAVSKNTITVGAVDDTGDMTTFSSWGPTDDGRIKPDLVAAGRSIYSTVPGNNYGFKSGTSMASPSISGAIILLNEKFNQTFGRLPKPSTSKALLIHTAEDLNRTGPDYITGWGLANSSEASQYIEESDSKDLFKTGELGQGDKQVYGVELDSNKSVKFTLVWSDYPGDTSASKALVNDLDLVVENPSGERKYPWTIDWSTRDQPASRDQRDRKNNVEQVYIENTEAGNYTVSVNGTDIPQPRQDYSLILTEKKGELQPPNITVGSPENRSYPQTPDFNFSSDKDLAKGIFSINGGRNRSMDDTSSREFYNTSTTLNSGGYSVKYFGEGTGGKTNSEELSFQVDKKPPKVQIESPENNSKIQGSFEVKASANDSLSGVKNREYYISNSTGKEVSGTLNNTLNSKNLADGDYQLIYNFTDNVDNSEIVNYTITISNPSNLVIESPKSRNYTETPDFNLSSNQALSNAVFSINGGQNRSMAEINSTYFSNTSATLPDGSHEVIFYGADTADNWNSTSGNFRIDSTSPSITLESPEDNSSISDTVDISAAISDASPIDSRTYQIIQNSSEVLSGSLNDSVNTTTLSDGEYNISYSAKDSLNNSDQKNISITVSNSLPTIKDWKPANNSNLSGIFDVEAAVSDSSGLKYQRFLIENSSSLQINRSLNGSVDSKNLADGTYSLDLVAEDQDGHRNSVNLKVNVRNKPPEITVFSPSNNSAVTDNIAIYAGVDVETSSSGYTLENQTGKVVSGEFNTSLNTSDFQDGNYNISYTATDQFNNTVEKKIQVELDNTPPIINLTEPSLDFLNEVFKVEAVWKDNLNTVEKHSYTLSDSNGDITSGSLNNSIDSTSYSDGNYNLTYTVEDSLGNRRTIRKQIRIDNTLPDISSVTVSDGEVFSDNFTVNAQTSDSSGVQNSSYTLRNGSGKQKSGSLGEKIVSDDYSDGNYTMEIEAWDVAENQEKQTYDLTLDNTRPKLDIFLPEKDSNISGSFQLEATAVDNSSEIVSLKFQINDSSGNITGDLNSSVDSSKLQNGEQIVFYTAEDQAGNTREASRIFTADNEKPDIKIIEPSSRFIAENISVTGIWSDDVTGIEAANYTLVNSTGLQSSGELNSSIQTSNLSEGIYNLSLKAYDYAENSDTSYNILEIDRTHPTIDSLTPESGENTSGTFNISASASDDRSLEKVVYLLENSTGKVTGYRELTNALDSTQFSGGNYSIVVKANDSAGNSITAENSDIALDNSPPSVSLDIFNESKKSGEWVKDNSTVKVSCNDRLTGNKNITVSSGDKIINYSSGVSSENFTFRENGRTNYSFGCKDFSGNLNSSEANLSIDSLKPGISSSDPGNGSETSREFNISIFFQNKTVDSGVNVSASNISLAPGKIDQVNWSNSSVNGRVSGLDYSEEFSVKVNISDRVGHMKVFRLDLVTVEDTSSSSDDDSDDSGGAGSFTETEDTENDTEESENNTLDDGAMAPSEKTYRQNLSSSPEKIDTSDSGTSIESAQISGEGKVELSISGTESGVEEPETVSRYDEINITAEGAESLEMNISFTVEKSWFRERNTDPGKTSLYRRNNSRWQELDTRMVEERNEEYVYKSQVPGFSTFMIGSEKSNSSAETLETKNSGDCKSPGASENLSQVENCTGKYEDRSAAGTHDTQISVGAAPVVASLLILIIGIYFGNSWRKKVEMKNEVESIRALLENNPQIESELIEAELSIQNNDFTGARERINSVREDLK